MELIAFFLVLGTILWLIYKKSSLKRPAGEQKMADPDLRLLSSPQKSSDPYGVLRHLLEIHPQSFTPRDIKRVLADCIPHDRIRLKNGEVVSCDWSWIVEMLPGRSPQAGKQFGYVLGFFDPTLTETRTFLHAWFFPTTEEALSPVINGLEAGNLIREPDQKLIDFLKSQLDRGEKTKRKPENYWESVSDPILGD